jgi:hypothetical protein
MKFLPSGGKSPPTNESRQNEKPNHQLPNLNYVKVRSREHLLPEKVEAT